MRSSRAKSIARQISMLGILAIVITGLTFLFNLFATIGVSVLAGMMAGASRRWNWQVITASFLPPLVALALGYFTKAPIDTQRGMYLIGICLGAFWGTWFATYFLMSLEAKNDTTREQEAVCSAIAVEPPSSSPRRSEFDDILVRRGVMVNGEASAHLIGDLQGTWRCEPMTSDKPSHGKLLVVDHGRFSLSFVGADGQSHIVVEGELIVQPEPGNKVLLASKWVAAR